MNPYVPILFWDLDARGGRKLRTDTLTHTWDKYSDCDRNELSGVFNGMEFLSIAIYSIYLYIQYIFIYTIIIIMFQAVRNAVNVLKLRFLRVSKYPLNAIFRNPNTLYRIYIPVYI